MSLKGIAKTTLMILEQGYYVNKQGQKVDIKEAHTQSVQGTCLYTPDSLSTLLSTSASNHFSTTYHVTTEKTQTAIRRLVQTEKLSNIAVLSFASARNVAGGFLNGAKAQEEDIARCTGIYPCLLTQPEFYKVNRACESLLYTDHIIYSPQVVWFREHNREVLDTPFTASIITAPAPNAGQYLKQNPKGQHELKQALYQRAGMVLAVAQDQGQEHLVLGAWGCGVFENNPVWVADAFMSWLEHERFKGQFKNVHFAIYADTDSEIYQAFNQRVMATSD